MGKENTRQSVEGKL